MVNIRAAAVKALPGFFEEYYDNSEDSLRKQELIVKSYAHQLGSETSEITRMGHSLALGALPKFMLKNNLNHIITSLDKCTVITMETLKWAESRRDAIKALTAICVTLDYEIHTGILKKFYLLMSFKPCCKFQS